MCKYNMGILNAINDVIVCKTCGNYDTHIEGIVRIVHILGIYLVGIAIIQYCADNPVGCGQLDMAGLK